MGRGGPPGVSYQYLRVHLASFSCCCVHRPGCTAARPLQRQVLCHDRRHAAGRSLAAKLGRTPQRRRRHVGIVSTWRRLAGRDLHRPRCGLMRNAKIQKAGHQISPRRELPTYRQAPTCRRTSFGIASELEARNLDVTRASRRFRHLRRPAPYLPLVFDHVPRFSTSSVRHFTTSGWLVTRLAPRRLLGARPGKRCGFVRRGGRSRQWPLRRRPRRRIRGRPRRWEFSGRPRVRTWRLRWKTSAARARPRRPANLRVAVLLQPLLRLRPALSRLPLQRVLRPVFTLLRSSILLVTPSVGLRPTRRPDGRPSRRAARSERERARPQDGHIGASRVSLRQRRSSDHLPVVRARTGCRSPPPRGRRFPIETTGTSTQLPTTRGVES
jgi:hypothetical protein